MSQNGARSALRGQSPNSVERGQTAPEIIQSDACGDLSDSTSGAAGTFEALTRRHGQMANLRLALGLAFAVMAWLGFSRHLFAARWLAVPVVLFGIIAGVHDRLLTGRVRARRAVRFYDRGIARLEDRWSGTGVTGQAYLPADHVYAADLDLFGPGSLFELISRRGWPLGSERSPTGCCRRPARRRSAPAGRGRRAPAPGRSSRAPLARRRRSRRLARHVASRRGDSHRRSSTPRPRAPRGDARRVERRDAGRVRSRRRLVARLVRPSRHRIVVYSLLWRARVSKSSPPPTRRLTSCSCSPTCWPSSRRSRPPTPRLQAVLARLPRAARRRRPASISCGGSSARSSRAATSSSRPSPRCCSGARNAPGRSRRGVARTARRWRGGSQRAGEFEALASLSGYAFEHPTDLSGQWPTPEAPLRRGGARASADSRGARGCQRRAAGRRHPRAARLGLEHVGQEHAAPHGRHRRGPRAGGRAGSRAAASDVAAGTGRDASRPGLAAGRALAVLRRNHAPSRDRRSDRRSDAGAVPAGRTAGRHELSRPARRRGGRREGTGGARRDRPGDDARPGAGGSRRTISASARRTCTSATRSRTARSRSTIGCGPASSRRATRWS